MSSTQQGVETGSNELGRGRVNKTDKTHRSWSSKEEQILLASLKELVAQGWKSDNRFRAEYLGKLEDAVKREFPGTDVKGMPHIHSKISTWKNNYYSLLAMLARSGVGFNMKRTHMIDCNNDQWEQIVKCDAKARLMRYKSWPLFDDWKEIFGKDRATGEHADDVMDAVNEMYRDDNVAQMNGPEGDYHVPLEDEAKNDNTEDNVCQSQNDEVVARGASKKRKVNDGLEGLYELLAELSRNADKRLENIASRIGYEFDLGKARKEVFELLSAITGLSLNNKFDVGEILVDKVELLELFMGLPKDARPHYVMRLLQAKNQ